MQLGPGLASLVVELHTEMGMPLAKVVDLLRTRLGVQVTTGGLVRLLQRTARDATPVYRELCRQVRNAPVVTPDETGWRVGAKSHWLWAFVTPETTVYAIRSRRGFDDAATVLGTDYAGVLVRDGYQVYRCYKGSLHQSCINHYADIRIMPMSARTPCDAGRPRRDYRHNHNPSRNARRASGGR